MHGFQSSFGDWGSEKTNHPRELLEVSLAHLPGDQTEQAYLRGDMIKRRRELMEEWAGFAVSGAPTPTIYDIQQIYNGWFGLRVDSIEH